MTVYDVLRDAITKVQEETDILIETIEIEWNENYALGGVRDAQIAEIRVTGKV